MRESQTTIPTYHKLSTLQTPSLYLCITLVMMWNTGCTVHWLPDEDSLDHLGSSVYWWCLLLLYYPHISQHWPVYALIILMYFCAKRKMHKYILQHCCTRSDRVIALHLVCLPLFPSHLRMPLGSLAVSSVANCGMAMELSFQFRWVLNEIWSWSSECLPRGRGNKCR